MTDERLRELYAEGLHRADGGPSCVGPEDLLALVRREGSEARRLEILDHVMGCKSCRREFDLLRALEHAGTETGGVERHSRPAWQWLGSLALAASLLIAVGLGLGVRYFSREPDVLRGGSPGVILLAPTEESRVAPPVTLVWRRVPSAHSYAVELLDSDGALVWSGATPDTSLVLSSVQLSPQNEYRWWVRTQTPSGQLASPMRRLRVRAQ